jgi:hypothetical protein
MNVAGAIGKLVQLTTFSKHHNKCTDKSSHMASYYGCLKKFSLLLLYKMAYIQTALSLLYIKKD